MYEPRNIIFYKTACAPSEDRSASDFHRLISPRCSPEDAHKAFREMLYPGSYIILVGRSLQTNCCTFLDCANFMCQAGENAYCDDDENKHPDNWHCQCLLCDDDGEWMEAENRSCKYISICFIFHISANSDAFHFFFFFF